MTPALRRLRRHDGGSVTLFAVVIVSGLLIALGLVVDGGGQLAAQRRADTVADQAARTGAQALDLAVFRSTGQTRLNAAAASAAARRYLADAGLTGTVEASATRVTVQVSATHATSVLSLIGLHAMTVHATGTATPVAGISTPETS